MQRARVVRADLGHRYRLIVAEPVDPQGRIVRVGRVDFAIVVERTGLA
jgi:hypothetical protein